MEEKSPPNKVEGNAESGTQERDERRNPGLVTSNPATINTHPIFPPALHGMMSATKMEESACVSLEVLTGEGEGT